MEEEEEEDNNGGGIFLWKRGHDLNNKVRVSYKK